MGWLDQVFLWPCLCVINLVTVIVAGSLLTLGGTIPLVCVLWHSELSSCMHTFIHSLTMCVISCVEVPPEIPTLMNYILQLWNRLNSFPLMCFYLSIPPEQWEMKSEKKTSKTNGKYKHLLHHLKVTLNKSVNNIECNCYVKKKHLTTIRWKF